MSPEPAPALSPVAVPVAAVIYPGGGLAHILDAEGEIRAVSPEQARTIPGPFMTVHAPYVQSRLKTAELPAFDLLELFAFVHPAAFCVPTPAGLAKALGLPAPKDAEDTLLSIPDCSRALLTDLRKESKRADLLEIVRVMGLNGKGWLWTPYVFAALGETYDPAAPVAPKTGLNVWRHLPEWAEEAPLPPPAHHAVTGEESRQRLREILGGKAEDRPQQEEYATAMTAAFAPVDDRDNIRVVLAEAGTGVGKTFGYLAPASVWARKNQGTVWVSTYTRNLQRQIGQELARLYPDSDLKETKTAIRKGRENYLCLLNFEELAAGAALARSPRHAVAAGLMARWAGATKDGDMNGGDFPGWLSGLLGLPNTKGLSDRRGECVYAACDHYHRCFVERSVRKAQRAEIVVANHALVMAQTALSGPDGDLPKRYVFDEGHHLFDAADGAFSGCLTARETAELRRWILGPEGGKKGRARGLKKRVEDLIEKDDAARGMLEGALSAARSLAAPDWSRRLKDRNPAGATEDFLLLVHQQVMARADGRDGPYSLETDTRLPVEGLTEAGEKLRKKLSELQKPLRALSAHLRGKLAEHADTWDSDTRRRVESVCNGIDYRCENVLSVWIDMLDSLKQEKTEAAFVDWMEIERIDGHAFDIGMHRRWIDPMIPFAAALRPHAHGVAITSATLRDRAEKDTDGWRSAAARTGASLLSPAPVLFGVESPYDYAARTRIFVVTDLGKENMEQVAAAYRVLFQAAGGGALGLFTAIHRLRAVHGRIAETLETKGIPLYAQHADGMDTGTLVDIFRDDVHACLLGTDAVRDGIDVPGDSLRLLVYDRVPWPRPTILHRARRNAYGGRSFDEMTTRMKLRQAYGRLVRHATDRGVFVMLDSALPSRLHTAFPEGVTVERLGLAETVEKVRDFLDKRL